MDYVKTIIRSILVSNPEKCTISQLLKDYVALEGQHLPYKQLGFNNVFEVLQNMKDVVKLPQHLSMDSTVTLVVDEKILHLRQLVVNQKKNKKRRTRNYYSDVNLNSGLRNSYGYNENNLNSYNAPRGYDYTKKLPVRSSRNKGFVTNQLQSSIENLCRNSQSTSLRVLKNCLITHPDYKLLNSNNIEEAINMLKYFIYIDKSGVHLKNCSSEIFPTKPSKLCNNIRPNFENFVKDVINEVEILDDDIEEDWFSTNEYYENLDNQQFNYDNTLVTKQKKENSCKMPEKAVDNQESKYNNNVVNQQKQENSCKIPERTVDNQESKYNNNVVTQQIKENSCKMFERAVDNQQSKYDNTVVNQQKQENSCEMPKVANNLSILAVQPKTQFKVNEDHALLAKDLDKCKNALTSIIASYKTPVTVDEVLKIFKKKYGYCFPIQNFSCRTVMDFFRLYPALFLLDDPYSSNSIIRLGKQPKPKRTIRHNFISASKFMYENEGYYENNNLTKYENASELVTNNITHQETNENDDNMHFSESSDIEIQDSHMILDSMKKKISLLLSKHKDGISCNTFMDVYGKEYNTYFTYSEYGFNSMRDMAYNLPSVFYVKVTEIGDCILYNASRRIELKKDCYDPSQYYKKIPKSIMHNLSSLFDNYRSGILFQELKQLYCSKFGRSYEPFKYGYTSERHMFESLNKMVKIENDIVYTLNPYAYIPFENNENSVNKSDKTLPVLPVGINLKN